MFGWIRKLFCIHRFSYKSIGNKMICEQCEKCGEHRYIREYDYELLKGIIYKTKRGGYKRDIEKTMKDPIIGEKFKDLYSNHFNEWDDL